MDREKPAEGGVYKADLHLHTTASDGRMSPRELYPLLSEKGYHLTAVTDHNAIEGSLWFHTQQMNDGKLEVIPGIEVLFWDKDRVWFSELLAYFRDPAHLESFYLKHIEPNKKTTIGFIPYHLEKVVESIKEEEGIIGIPHPYSKKGIQHGRDLMQMEEASFVEVWNGMSTQKQNENAAALEGEGKEGLIYVSNSDYHFLPSALESHTLIESEKPPTLDAVFDQLEGKKEDMRFVPVKGPSLGFKERMQLHLAALRKH